MALIKDMETLRRLQESLSRSSGRITRLPMPEEIKSHSEIRGEVKAQENMLVIKDVETLQRIAESMSRSSGQITHLPPPEELRKSNNKGR